jgi:23S rRNA (adenine2503-C2)-methyltransferase
MQNLLDFDRPALTEWFRSRGEKPFRAQQVLKWIHQQGCDDFDAMSNLGKSLREALKSVACIQGPGVAADQRSSDGSRKWLFELADGNRVESVYIPEQDRATLCVSSQVGCAELQFLLDGAAGLQSQPHQRRDYRPVVDGQPAARRRR